MEKLRIGRREGSKFGTERTRRLLNALGSPDKKLKIIHVAGSNGKGSVCAMLTSILVAAGKRTGTFTSPFVFDPRGQFCIDGSPADMLALKAAAAEVACAAEDLPDSPSEFEKDAVTALALFAGEGCEYCVLECGLGGLYDATNAIRKKKLAIITSVSLEHTDVLGADIMDICRHKGGIINGCPALVPSNLPKEAEEYFVSLGATVVEAPQNITLSEEGTAFTFGGSAYFTPLFGEEQAYNATLSVTAARMLGLGQKEVSAGLARTSLNGRVQTVKRGGATYILDGSHNPAAFAPLLQRLAFESGQKTLVYTCLSDKHVKECAAILAPAFAEIILTPAPSVRAMDINMVKEAFLPYKNVRSCADIPSALAQATYKTVVVCGSFTPLKEALDWIEQRQ